MRHIEYMMKRLREEEEPKYLSGTNKEDMVNSPAHYNKSGIETIQAIKAMTDNGFEHYLQGNILKYIWRYRYKNGAEDLRKAQWYLNELIDVVENDNKS